MTTTKRKLLTAEDLLELHSKGVKGELIRGVLAETASTGVEHGKITAKFTIKVGIFVEPQKLGTIVTSDSGVLVGRNPDVVREPDVAFTSARECRWTLAYAVIRKCRPTWSLKLPRPEIQ